MAARSAFLLCPTVPFQRSGWPRPGWRWSSPLRLARAEPLAASMSQVVQVDRALRDGNVPQLIQGLSSIAPETLALELPRWLHRICQEPGRSGCLDPLLAWSAALAIDPGRFTDAQGVTPLMRAASYGDWPMVRRLVPWCPVDARDHQDHDALWRAADHGHVDVIAHLALMGDPSRCDRMGRSAWTQAARREVPDVLRTLLNVAPLPPQEHMEHALDLALQERRWRNTHLLVQAMNPSATLAHLSTASGPWIDDLRALAHVQEAEALRACTTNGPPAPITRGRPRL